MMNLTNQKQQKSNVRSVGKPTTGLMNIGETIVQHVILGIKGLMSGKIRVLATRGIKGGIPCLGVPPQPPQATVLFHQNLFRNHHACR
jgi:hypothetical protein